MSDNQAEKVQHDSLASLFLAAEIAKAAGRTVHSADDPVHRQVGFLDEGENQWHVVGLVQVKKDLWDGHGPAFPNGLTIEEVRGLIKRPEGRAKLFGPPKEPV